MRSSWPLFLSPVAVTLSLARFLFANLSSSSLDNPRWKTWHDRHRYLFNFRKVGGVVAKKAGRPVGWLVGRLAGRSTGRTFCLLSPLSRKKDDGSRLRKEDGKKKKRGERKRGGDARLAAPTSLSYLWREITAQRVSVRRDDFSFRCAPLY